MQRALLLYEQARHELAETELRQALAADPHDAHAHALLALCLTERKQFKEATEEVHQAIDLSPDTSFVHYAHARVLCDRNHYREALAAIEEAIRLDPEDADFFALLAGIHFDERRWQEALKAAETGLQFDPEHTGCTNLRAMAMVKLGRRKQAGATIGAALAKNPENSLTHANQGWTLLEEGDPRTALEHFRESLRLDPENEWARHGIVEALKARNVIYAVMLKYFLWMAKLSPGAQWGIILGGYFGMRILGGMAASNPALATWVLPVRIIYVTFVVLTWTAYPMFNLLLRLNRFGRLALSREQMVESNWVGSALLLALISLGGCIAMGFGSPWVMSLAVFGLLMLPLSGLFRCSEGWPRWIMIAAVSVLAVVGTSASAVMWQAYLGNDQYVESTAEAAFGLLSLFSVGVLASTLLANFLASKRPRL